MKIQHLHLSDSHITCNNTVNYSKIAKMVQALKSVESFDECTILFSGDLANAGYENQYKSVKNFIGKLVNEIRTQCNFPNYINVCVTPGNHDMLADMDNRPRDKFWKAAKKAELDTFIGEELDLMNNFMSFAQSTACFKYNKLISRKLVHYGKENKEYLACYNLINSSLYSIKDEKGIHYLPKSEIETLYEAKNAQLNMTIIHHSPEWFFTKIKDELEKALYENSNIICMGHEHNGECEIKEIEDETGVLIVRGAELSEDGSEKSEFYSILFDTETNISKVHKYTWDVDAEFYRTENKKEFCCTSSKNGGKKLFALNHNFVKNLYNDGKESLGISYRDYFVFPILSGKSYSEYKDEERIKTMDEFINLLKINKRIFIKGDDRVGKTTLMKEIFFELSKNYVPLFIPFESGDKIKLNTIIKHAFQEQYSDDPKIFELYYEQIPSERRAIVIDGIHLVKKGEALDEFWGLLKDKFSIVIVSGRYDFDFNILEQVKDQIDVEESYYELQLNGLFAGKRKELISKVYPIIKKHNILENSVEIETLDNILKQSLNFFRVNPSYIIQFVSWAHDNKSFDKGHSWAIFGKVFEANIVKEIEATSNAIDVGQIMLITGQFAISLYLNHISSVSYDQFKSTVENYNEKHGESVDSKLLMSQLIDSKIIKKTEDENHLRFSDNNYLSFFIAKEMLRIFNNEHDATALQIVLDKICLGINGDILLFIIYMTENTEILMKIYETALSHVRDWEEYSIKNGNLKFLDNIKTSTEMRAPSKKDEQEEEENNTNQEIEQEQKIKMLEAQDVFDYEDKELQKESSKFSCAVKYTELLCKGFAGFSYLLTKEQKEAIIDSIYKFPNKIVFFLLRDLDENFEEYVDDLEQFVKENKNYITKGRMLERGEIIELIERVSMGQILTYFDMAAFYATNIKTIDLLNNYKELENNYNYRIQNTLMLSNINRLDEFIQKTDDLYKELGEKKKSGEYYIKQIISHHLISHKVPRYKQQSLISKYFSPQGNKAILYKKNVYDKRR